MWKYIIGYIVISIVYFFFKWSNYSYLEKTKGVVIDSRSFSYGRMSRIGSRNSRSEVPYPIARFKGPPTTIIEGNDITQAEVDNIDIEISKLGSITQEMANGIKAYKIDSVKKSHVKIAKTVTEYTTATPWGAFFFSSYRNGDSIDVVYEYNHPREGKVCTLFSYWLPLPSICIIVFICFVWAAIIKVASMPRGY